MLGRVVHKWAREAPATTRPGHSDQVAGTEAAPLWRIVVDLDRRAEVLRARAATVGASTGAARWTSPGARAWIESTHEIQAALVTAARAVEQAADLVRRQAVRR